MNQVPLPATTLYAPDYPILTDRLSLRPFTRGDVDAVFAYRQRPDVARFLFDPPLTHEDCAEAVRARASQIAFTAESDKILLAVQRRDGGGLIGEVSLIWRSAAEGRAEIGYILHPDAQGHGYATEAAHALLAFAFATVGLRRVFARCHARNVASANVMRRLGMRRQAHVEGHAQVEGSWDEELVFAIGDEDWRGARPQLPIAANS